MRMHNANQILVPLCYCEILFLIQLWGFFPSKPCNFLVPHSRVQACRQGVAYVLSFFFFCHPSVLLLSPDLMSPGTAQAANGEGVYLHPGTDGEEE